MLTKKDLKVYLSSEFYWSSALMKNIKFPVCGKPGSTIPFFGRLTEAQLTNGFLEYFEAERQRMAGHDSPTLIFHFWDDTEKHKSPFWNIDQEWQSNEKHKLAYLRERKALSIARAGSRWITLGKSQHWCDETFPLRLRREKETFPIAGHAIKPQSSFPGDWEHKSWICVTLVITTKVKEILCISFWSPTEKTWKSLSSFEEMENPALGSLADAFLSQVHEEYRRYYDSDYYLSFRSAIAVSSFCLSENDLITCAPDEAIILPEVSPSNLEEQIYFSDRAKNAAVYQETERKIVELINSGIETSALLSLPVVVKNQVEENKNSIRHGQIGGYFDFSLSELQRVTNRLCDLHGIERFEAKVEKSVSSYPARNSKLQDRKHFFETSVSIADAVAIRERYLRDGVSAFTGSFWKEYNPIFTPGSESLKDISSVVVMSVSSLPRDEVIERVVSFRPEAEPMMRQWRKIWDRSFPDWLENNKWPLAKMENSYEDYWLDWGSRIFDDKGYDRSDVSKFYDVDRVINVNKKDLRDYRLHVIDEADIVLNMGRLSPGLGVLDVMGRKVLYDGVDDDGLPRFIYATGIAADRVTRRLRETPRYWNWPFFLKYLGRKLVVAPARHAAAEVLLDMAQQGHSHAFLKRAKGKGTWTMPLTDLITVEDAEDRLAGLIPDQRDLNLVIQEHLPFTHEQRFYINNGRVFASACSDRNFCVLDASGKRLDDRVSVLNCPSINQGYFDRGVTSHVRNRDLAATFARQARRIARELKDHGILEYSLDMGLTDRGPVCIEINTLHRAGPYNLDRRFYMDAFRAKEEWMKTHLDVGVRAEILKITQNVKLQELASSLVNRNIENLPKIFVAQYDQMAPGNISDPPPTELRSTVAKCFLLAALMEQPVTSSTNGELAA
jgi:hypothetical protein